MFEVRKNKSNEGDLEGVLVTNGEENSTEAADKGEQLEQWKTVSLEKSSRSPRKSVQELKHGKETIITSSRFAALSNLEENKEEEIKQLTEDNEEKELSGENQEKEIEAGEVQTEKLKVVESEIRQILPRNSKTYHKVLYEGLNKNETGIMTRSSRKNH